MVARAPRPADLAMSVFAIAGVAFVFAPVLPGVYWALRPGFSGEAWLALLASNEWPQAVRATLVSTILSTAFALLMAGAIASSTFPGRAWTVLGRRLSLLLAVPHAAFAVGLSFLIAPSGWLARLIAQLIGWTLEKNKKPGLAYYKYQEKFGVAPSMAKPAPMPPGPEVCQWIKSRQIAYAKRKVAS